MTHDYLYPRYALLDPSLTLSLSPRQTAISGMDALCHALEGYWSNLSTAVTDAFALVAARLLLSMLPEAYRRATDLRARKLAMHGSLLAGLTISNAKTTAVHSASYPMTVFKGVPHGLACAMLLPSFIRYNDGAMDNGKQRDLLSGLGLDSMERLAEVVESLKAQLELPGRLRDLGFKRTDIATIVENGFRPDRVGNNPREVTPADLRHLLEAIL